MVEVVLIDTLEIGSRVWIASIQQAKEFIELKLDSGAKVTFLPGSTYRKLQVKPELQVQTKYCLVLSTTRWNAEASIPLSYP